MQRRNRTTDRRGLKEWELLWALFITQDTHQQQLLCAELLQLPAERINRYLLEYVYLAVSRPSGPIERAITELCGRSFNTAVQVSWLLLALLQDQPGNRHIRQFRDACEHAALMGGAPSHPHYTHTFSQAQPYQQQQQQQTSPLSISTPATPATDSDAAASIPASPFAFTAACGSVPASSLGTPSSTAVAASPDCAASGSSAVSIALAAASGGSLSSSHRFRDLLDLELMRHASQDLAAAAAAAGAAAAASGGAGGTPPRKAGSRLRQQQQQQQQGGRAGSPLHHHHQQQQQQQGSRAGSPLQQQQQQQPDQQLLLAGKPHALKSIRTSSSPSSGKRPSSEAAATTTSSSSSNWAVPGSVAARFTCFEEYLSAREYELYVELGPGQGVSELIAASHAAALSNGPQGAGWLVSHEEALLSTSMLLEMPPRSPRHAAGRDSYLATLDFVDALCETSASLTRFPPEERRRVLRKCLGRINQEVMGAAEQGVAVRYPIGGCSARVLRLLVSEAAILNSRDKAPFLLMLEVQQDQDFVDEVIPGTSSSRTSASTSRRDAAADTAAAGTDAAASPFEVAAVPAASSDDVQIASPDQQQQQHAGHLPSRQQQLLEQLHQQQQRQQQQQQRSRPFSSKGGAMGASPLSRGSSPAPEAAPQHSNTSAAAAPAAAAAAAAKGQVSGGGMGRQAAAATESVGTNGSAAAGSEAHSDTEEQQQQQRGSAEQWSSGSNSSSSPSSRQQLQIPDTPIPESSVASHVEGAAITAAPAKPAATKTVGSQLASMQAATAAELPTAVELQMQDAAAVLRGEKLVRLHLRFLDPGHVTPSNSSGSGGSSRNIKRRSIDRSNVSDDCSAGPWVFGELPASSSSGDIQRASIDFSAGKAAGNSSIHGSSTAAAAAAAGQLLQVHLEVVAAAPMLALHHRKGRRLPSLEAIDIMAGKLGKAAIPPPTEIGPPLQLPGELSSSSSSSIEGDAECVPYLAGAYLSSSQLKRVDEVDAAGAASGGSAAAAAASGGSAAAAAAAAAIAAEGAQGSAAPGAAAAGCTAAAAGCTAAAAGCDTEAGDTAAGGVSTAGQPSRSNGAVTKCAVSTASRGSRTSSSSDGGGSVRVMPDHESWQDVATKPAAAAAAAAAAPRHQKQQQQQQKASSGWWGFLRKQQPAAAVHADQLVNQQLDAAAEESAEAAAERAAQQADAVYGESWAARCARVRAASPFGSRPGWGLAGVIVKSGDDCRQELMALQLIRELGDIWTAAGLPLYVLPFDVLVTSAGTALIQLIPDATSVHSIKARSAAAAAAAAAAAEAAAGASPSAAAANAAAAAAAGGGVSLSQHFFAKWRRGSAECLAAQRRFVESLAAYSLIMYLLQVKDRHNGNIMMDSSGRLVHIDFGFLLSNAPGGSWVRFEASPMKLSREFLEVMDSGSEGQPSELFDYFKVLCIQGFLAARKERRRIVRLVTIMADCSRPNTAGSAAANPLASGPSSSSGSGAGSITAGVGGVQAPSWPCFIAGPERVVAALEGRFVPHLSESACVQHVLRLISSSLDAWSTRQYDYYQRVLNGIL